MLRAAAYAGARISIDRSALLLLTVERRRRSAVSRSAIARAAVWSIWAIWGCNGSHAGCTRRQNRPENRRRRPVSDIILRPRRTAGAHVFETSDFRLATGA